jgi:hypothetical protein
MTIRRINKWIGNESGKRKGHKCTIGIKEIKNRGEGIALT